MSAPDSGPTWSDGPGTGRQPVRLVSFDLTGTLAEIDGESHTALLCRASPLPAERVREILHDDMRLKLLSDPGLLTDELVGELCGKLRVDRSRFPFGSVRMAPYRMLPGAAAAVRTVAHAVPAGTPIVIVTDSSVFAQPGLDRVVTDLQPWIDAAHPSWRTGMTKDDPRVFELVATEHNVPVAGVVHVGDSWSRDVVPALAAGARAVWLNRRRLPRPEGPAVPPGRLLSADTPEEAVNLVAAWWL